MSFNDICILAQSKGFTNVTSSIQVIQEKSTFVNHAVVCNYRNFTASLYHRQSKSFISVAIIVIFAKYCIIQSIILKDKLYSRKNNVWTIIGHPIKRKGGRVFKQYLSIIIFKPLHWCTNSFWLRSKMQRVFFCTKLLKISCLCIELCLWLQLFLFLSHCGAYSTWPMDRSVYICWAAEGTGRLRGLGQFLSLRWENKSNNKTGGNINRQNMFGGLNHI